MPPDSLTDLLPWRHPFLLIDRLIECVPHRSITTIKQVSGNDILAHAHGPGPNPGPGPCLWPGLLVLEGLNQTAALLVRLTYGPIDAARRPLVGRLRARFPGSAAPGDTITYSVRAVKMTSTHGLFEGAAQVGGKRIVEAELALAVVRADGGTA